MARSSVLIIAFSLACTGALSAAPADERVHEVRTHDQRDNRSPDGRQERRWTKWWVEAKERAELGITDEQSSRIEQIFQAHMPDQRERWRELQQLERSLAKMIKESTADVATVTALVTRVEDLRAEMAKARTIMLYRVHLELTAEQRARLKAMEDRAAAERRKTMPAGSPRR